MIFYRLVVANIGEYFSEKAHAAVFVNRNKHAALQHHLQ